MSEKKLKIKIVFKYAILSIFILIIAYCTFRFLSKIIKTDALITTLNPKYDKQKTLKVIGGDRYFLLDKDNKISDNLIDQDIFPADTNDNLKNFEFEFFDDYDLEYNKNVAYAFSGLGFHKMKITSIENPVIVQTSRRTFVFNDCYMYLKEGTIVPSIDNSAVKDIVIGFERETIIDEKSSVDKLISCINSKEDFLWYLKELGYDINLYLEIYVEYENFPGMQYIAFVRDGELKYV